MTGEPSLSPVTLDIPLLVRNYCHFRKQRRLFAQKLTSSTGLLQLKSCIKSAASLYLSVDRSLHTVMVRDSPLGHQCSQTYAVMEALWEKSSEKWQVLHHRSVSSFFFNEFTFLTVKTVCSFTLKLPYK